MTPAVRTGDRVRGESASEAAPSLGWPLALAAVLAWALRPFAYAAVLDGTPRDGHLIRLDPHAFGLLWDVNVHAAGLPVLLLALWWLARRHGSGEEARADGWRGAASWGLVLLVGTPSIMGTRALRELPFSLSWPVVLSSLLWLTVCVLLRQAWARDGRG